MSAPSGERTIAERGARADAPGRQVRETVHEARARFRAEHGFRNQGQAIRAALRARRHPEPEATDTDGDGDETTGAVDTGSDTGSNTGNDATGGVSDAPLGTQGTLDLLA